MLSLRKLYYSFGLLCLFSGLLALQSAVVNVYQQDIAPYNTTIVLQERVSVQPPESSGRTQNSTLSAPVRAILTPALNFINKALPFGSDGALILTAIFTLLALFSPAGFVLNRYRYALKAFKTAIRARAPPAIILA